MSHDAVAAFVVLVLAVHGAFEILWTAGESFRDWWRWHRTEVWIAWRHVPPLDALAPTVWEDMHGDMVPAGHHPRTVTVPDPPPGQALLVSVNYVRQEGSVLRTVESVRHVHHGLPEPGPATRRLLPWHLRAEPRPE